MPPPSSSRASSTHSERPKLPLHSRSWLEQEVAKLKQQQLCACLLLRGRGSRPRGRQPQNPRRPPVFYQDQNPTARGSSRPRGISKRSRPYIGNNKRYSKSQFSEYHRQNVAILSVHCQREYDGAIPYVHQLGYIPQDPSNSPNPQP
jgi:hypothetical protein